jgi:hypothetical protein
MVTEARHHVASRETLTMMVFLNFFLEVSTFSVSILVGQMFEQ